MARKRMIHPDFFTSSTMNSVPVSAMLTFAGVWCWADDYGRGEDDAALIKAAVWPRRRAMSEKKVAEDVESLVSAGVLCRYEVADHPLLHVINWREHQKVQHPTASKLPPCPHHEPEKWREFAGSDDPATEKFRTDSRISREGLRSAS